MDRAVTMKDIAKALGISVVTVSKALAGKDGASPKLREQIFEKAKELNYVPVPKKVTEEKKHYNIGVLVADHFFSDNAFYAEMYRYIVKSATKARASAIMEIVQKEEEEQGRLPQLITENRADVVIFLGQFTTKYLRGITKTQLPFVFLDCYEDQLPGTSILSDSETGMFHLMQYLIETGHKTFAYVGNIDATSSIMDRYLGCIKALLTYHLPLESIQRLEDRDEDGKQISVALPEVLPDAFVCNCDMTAFYLISQLKEKGYRVPEDVSVTGFDDYMYAALLNPSLTTYKVDIAGMATAAVEAALKKCKKSRKSEERITLPGVLIKRESVIQR